MANCKLLMANEWEGRRHGAEWERPRGRWTRDLAIESEPRAPARRRYKPRASLPAAFPRRGRRVISSSTRQRGNHTRGTGVSAMIEALWDWFLTCESEGATANGSGAKATRAGAQGANDAVGRVDPRPPNPVGYVVRDRAGT